MDSCVLLQIPGGVAALGTAAIVVAKTAGTVPLAGHDMASMAMDPTAGVADTPATTALTATAASMHGAKDVLRTQNDGIDFIDGRVPHHMGASSPRA